MENTAKTIVFTGNINSVKQHLGVDKLRLNTAETSDGVKIDWMRHWDNTSRVAVSIHKDTVAAVKADASCSLGLQTETRTGPQGEYQAFRIVKFSAAEVEL
jgi:hypothetical protein